MPRYTAAPLLLTTVSCVAEALAREEDGDLAFKATIGQGRGRHPRCRFLEHRVLRQHSNGPPNETLQLSDVRDVIAGTDFDIWGMAEIVSTIQFNALASSDSMSMNRIEPASTSDSRSSITFFIIRRFNE